MDAFLTLRFDTLIPIDAIVEIEFRFFEFAAFVCYSNVFK